VRRDRVDSRREPAHCKGERATNTRAKGIVLNQIIEHDNEMYGIGTVYQRLKGVVPPSTEQQGQRGEGTRELESPTR
jgi:hypothetical protein